METPHSVAVHSLTKSTYRKYRQVYYELMSKRNSQFDMFLNRDVDFNMKNMEVEFTFIN